MYNPTLRLRDMHSIDSAHVTPFGPRGEYSPRDIARTSAPSGAENHRHENEHVRRNARDRDFVGNVLSAHILSALQTNYRITSVVPVAGMTPAQVADQGLAGAARQALASGEKGADSLRESVRSGIKDASSLLQGLGAAVEEVSALAENIRSRLETFISSLGSAQSGNTARESIVGAGTRFTQKQKTNLEIVTQEGDTVRLSLKSKQDVSVSGVASSSRDGTASVGLATVISGSKFTISVEGDLNEDETAAIQNVLTKVEALSEKFFQGDVETAFAAAADLNIDTGQLASVELDLKLRQRLETVAFASTPFSAQPLLTSPFFTSPFLTDPVASQLATPPAISTLPATQAPELEDDDLPSASATTAEIEDDSAPTQTGNVPGESPAANATPSPFTIISGYLKDVLNSLLETGQTDNTSVSFKFKLDLLLAATSTRHETQSAQDTSAADDAGDAATAIDKLDEALTGLA